MPRQGGSHWFSAQPPAGPDAGRPPLRPPPSRTLRRLVRAPGAGEQLQDPWASPGRAQDLLDFLSRRMIVAPGLAERLRALDARPERAHEVFDQVMYAAYACLGPAALDLAFEAEDATGTRWGLAPRSCAVALDTDDSIQVARVTGSRLATRLGFGAVRTTKVATAVSELARNVVMYAGQGSADFHVRRHPAPELVIEVSDQGPGIADIEAILGGGYRSRTGLGMGLRGVVAIADEFHVDTAPGRGTRVRVAFRKRP
ncbi:MAG: anti-sigma regulatory factor [Planctomycetota bacterium]